jgi:hypothetical protein
MLAGAAAGTGSLALGAAGALIVLVAGTDLFLTVFNYDGFTFIAGRYQQLLWKIQRILCRLLPSGARHTALSLGSAAMLPATVALWLGLEITGFAFMFFPGLQSGNFELSGADRSLGTGFYLSAGDISSLTFGDVVARAGLDRALADLETIFGLATFTLALGYVVTTFDVLGRLENLHGRVRRHAEDPERPSSILARHFRGGNPSDLPSFLQALADDLDSYDQGLRRYPVVYYFHTRRERRSIPHVFATLGELLSLLRWGLPASEPMSHDPYLVALLNGYTITLERLRTSFVGPTPIHVPDPLPRPDFLAAYQSEGANPDVGRFQRLEQRAHEATGLEAERDPEEAYERYHAWFPFAYRQRMVLERVADALGYERPRATSTVAY